MEEFADKLNKILNDPQGMQQIISLAKTLGDKDSAVQQSDGNVPDTTPQVGLADAAPLLSMLKSLKNSPAGQAFLSGEKERIRLLNALKPYMGELKKEKLTKVISVMESMGTISSLAGLL